jgi:4-amino-4-deoxy-L-arabinose transferase-like glycosyltransferase
MFHRPLYEPDEGRYAQIPQEMLMSGDWVVPHLNGFVYIEKPPLQYWMTSIAYSVFGVHDWSARLWIALAGWFTVVVIAVYVAKHRGRRASVRTWTFGITSLIWMLVAHQLTLDTSLTLFTTIALIAYCESQASARTPPWLNYAMWAALACAVLTKGFVALVLPAGAFVLYCVRNRDWRRWRSLHLVRGAIVLTLLIAPWMIAMQRRVPEFFDFFVVREHFLRYLTPIARRTEPWWFFIPLLIVGTMPWTGLLFKALFTAKRRFDVNTKFSDRDLLWISAVAIFLFFSVSNSKLVPYILPMAPLLWVLACDSSEDETKDMRASAVGSLLFAMCSAIAVGYLSYKETNLARIVIALRPHLIGVLGLIAVGSITALLLGKHSAQKALVALGVGWMLAALLLELGPTAINNLYSAKDLSHSLLERGAGSATVYSVETYDQTLTFYLGHPVKLVRYRGELDFGISRDAQNYIPTLEQFIRLWEASSDAFAVMRPGTYDELRTLNVTMSIVARDANYIAVSR